MELHQGHIQCRKSLLQAGESRYEASSASNGYDCQKLKKNFEDTAKVLVEMCAVMKDFKRVHTNDFISL